MGSWLPELVQLGLLLIFLISFIVLLIALIVRKFKKKKIIKTVCLLVIDTILFALVLIFHLSHSTYYKFNDWYVLNSDINSVVEKYGPFDKGELHEGKEGKIGYYIYTDNGPIMPDHAPHYYWISFDEFGNVYDVNESLPAGG